MRNNCLLILCLCLLAEGIYAQNADKGKNVTKNSVSTAQKTNAALREARFDPRKPVVRGSGETGGQPDKKRVFAVSVSGNS